MGEAFMCYGSKERWSDKSTSAGRDGFFLIQGIPQTTWI